MGDSLVDKVKNAMPQEEDLIEVAELFKAFGDPGEDHMCAEPV